MYRPSQRSRREGSEVIGPRWWWYHSQRRHLNGGRPMVVVMSCFLISDVGHNWVVRTASPLVLEWVSVHGSNLCFCSRLDCALYVMVLTPVLHPHLFTKALLPSFTFLRYLGAREQTLNHLYNHCFLNIIKKHNCRLPYQFGKCCLSFYDLDDRTYKNKSFHSLLIWLKAKSPPNYWSLPLWSPKIQVLTGCRWIA